MIKQADIEDWKQAVNDDETRLGLVDWLDWNASDMAEDKLEKLRVHATVIWHDPDNSECNVKGRVTSVSTCDFDKIEQDMSLHLELVLSDGTPWEAEVYLDEIEIIDPSAMEGAPDYILECYTTGENYRFVFKSEQLAGEDTYLLVAIHCASGSKYYHVYSSDTLDSAEYNTLKNMDWKQKIKWADLPELLQTYGKHAR